MSKLDEVDKKVSKTNGQKRGTLTFKALLNSGRPNDGNDSPSLHECGPRCCDDFLLKDDRDRYG